MASWLFPRLPTAYARQLATERARAPVAELTAVAAARDDYAVYAPTGGNRIPEARLKELADRLRKIAKTSAGFPEPPDDARGRASDANLAICLHEHSEISPSEAS